MRSGDSGGGDRPVKLGPRLVVGALAGIVGTMAMTVAMRRLHSRLPEKERYPLPPREIVDSAAAPPEEAGRDATVAAHFAYGAACGAMLAAADPRIGTRTGAAAGAAIWVASYMGWIPALGILKPATRHPIRRSALMVGCHLLWGAATARAIRELAAARETVFAGREPRDAPGPHRAIEAAEISRRAG